MQNTRVKTIREIEKLHQLGLFAIGGVPGLYLRVTNSGKYYVFRCTIEDKRRSFSLGNARWMTLAEAREKATKMKIAQQAGKPIKRTRKKRATTPSATVEEMAGKWLKARKGGRKKFCGLTFNMTNCKEDRVEPLQ
ncbi:MAG: Arm DNA-binding domain-containing protein [Sutterellaceae bacterium]|nr:Arm DNA-binding domain-containing protein [Sutterellaceae bacterium]MDD7441628.1 Arm DNA-binding domain-containing protein [Sutterellaceae bacterium]MDY2868979.1 Arm DNA-binding domain-containing protein [Mesosutterella sp.]